MTDSSSFSNSLDIENLKVAIVLPVYNVAPYLAECIDSIFAQTHQNFVVFAVDDGSTDGSGKILDEYTCKSPKIVLIRQRNSGLGAARNVALDKIEEDGTFDYVSFVDSDDRCRPDFLEKLLRSAHKYTAEIVFCSFFDIVDNSEVDDGLMKPEHILDRDEFVEALFSQLRWKGFNGAGGMVWKAIFQADLVRKIRFPSERWITEDEVYSIQTACNCHRIAYVPERLYGYRKRSGSLLGNPDAHCYLYEARRRCIPIAASISNASLLIATSACIEIAIHLIKHEGKYHLMKELPNYRPEVIRAASQGVLSAKHYKQFLFYCNFGKTARIYLEYRRIVKYLQDICRNFRKRMLQKSKVA